jgi:hypothetical protein
MQYLARSRSTNGFSAKQGGRMAIGRPTRPCWQSLRAPQDSQAAPAEAGEAAFYKYRWGNKFRAAAILPHSGKTLYRAGWTAAIAAWSCAMS